VNLAKGLFLASLLCGSAGNASQGAGPFFEVKADRGVPRIFKDGRVVPSRMFFGSFLHGGFPRSWEAVPREFGHALDSGVLFFEGHGSLLWEGCDEEKVKAENRKMANAFFAAAKDGRECYMIVRLNCNPPKWWQERHPEAINRWNDPSKIDGWIARFPLQSLASETYQRHVVDALKRTVAFYEAEFPGRMAGYHCGGLHTSEWVYDGNYRPETEGYDESTRRGFRKYLRGKYGDEAALRRAWRDEAVTFDSADVPPHETRCGDGRRFLRTWADDARLLDFNEFRTRLVSQTINRLARTIKERAPGRLTGFFYCYFSQSTWYGGGGRNGYLSCREVLDSPNVDFFCSPFNYNWRQADRALSTQGLTGSIAIAGKLWLNEDDTATYLACRTNDGGPSMMSKCPTPESTADMLRRNLAYSYMNNQAIWWMDLNGAGWFDDPSVWKTMRDFLPLERELLENPVASCPEFGVAFDQRGAMHFEGMHFKESAPPNWANMIPGEFNGLGAPFGVYLSDDVLAGRADSLKLALFPTSYAMDVETRAAMRSFAAKNGCIWVWAPGYVDLDGKLDPCAAVKDATGFAVKELPADVTLRAKATARGKELFGLPDNLPFGPRFAAKDVDRYAPVLSPVLEKGDDVLATYRDGSPSIVMRHNKAGRPLIFCGTCAVPPELCRKAAEQAGVRFYAPTGTAIYTNGRDLCVYATKDGPVRVTLPVPGRWCDYFTGREFDGASFDAHLRQGETLLLRRKLCSRGLGRRQEQMDRLPSDVPDSGMREAKETQRRLTR